MSKKTYNKLVRDKIPEIIKASGKDCNTEILPDNKYIEMLDKKLVEECDEYLESKSLEELADILEVLRAITTARGYSLDELEKIRKDKAETRGGFNDKILLKEVV